MLLLENHSSLEDFEIWFEARHYAAGEMIFAGGSVSDGVYWVKSGIVRLEAWSSVSEDRQEASLAFLEASAVLGEIAFFDGGPRSASAFAQTDSSLLYLSQKVFQQILLLAPEKAVGLLMFLGKELSGRFRKLHHRLDLMLVSQRDDFVEGLLDKAESAQAALLGLPEDSLNAFLSILAARLADASEELALLAVKETGMGNPADKRIKNRLASLGLLEQLLAEPGYGEQVLTETETVYELKDPLGTILAVLPVSNPTSTFIFKVLIAFKSRNALVVVPHRRALMACERVGQIVHDVLLELGLPQDLLQWRGMDQRKRVVNLMRNPRLSLILATGSSELVRASYSSGNPAIGVGSGNTPVLLADVEDLDASACGIVKSKSFDFGLICGAEHNLLVVDELYEDFVLALERAGAAFLSGAEALRFRAAVIDQRTGRLAGDCLGQSAAALAIKGGILRPYPIDLLVVPLSEVLDSDPFAYEKLAPIVTLMRVETAEEGVRQAQNFLKLDGRGHTAVIYSQDEVLVNRFAVAMPVSRILVNSPAAPGVVGITTDLPISLVLACGSYGKSSTTDNVSVGNLFNRKRVASVRSGETFGY